MDIFPSSFQVNSNKRVLILGREKRACQRQHGYAKGCSNRYLCPHRCRAASLQYVYEFRFQRGHSSWLDYCYLLLPILCDLNACMKTETDTDIQAENMDDVWCLFLMVILQSLDLYPTIMTSVELYRNSTSFV